MKDSRDRGAVTVEFAFIIPLLLLLILAVVEFGYRYERGTVLNNAAFIAARDMSITGHTVGTATTAARSAGAPSAATISISPSTCTADADITVTITSTQDSATKAFGATFTVHGKGVSRCPS